MADTITFPELGRRVELLQKQVGGRGLKELTTAVAVKTKGDPHDAAQADPMNGSFSGWRRGNPIELTARYNQWESKPGVFEVVPTPKAGGPWRVAESGRNQGNASGFSGPGINTRTGVTSFTKAGKVRKVRARKARRWNGTTRGFDTWSDAEKLMEARVPLRVQVQVSKVLGRVFRG